MADIFLGADVLVIGGGIAGSFAAIKACEAGAQVVIFEKGALERSGGASVGILCWSRLPPPTMKPEDLANFSKDKRAFWGEARVLKGLINENLDLIGTKENWHRLHDLENWGMKMRGDDGEYNLVTGYDGTESSMLRFPGTFIKRKIAEKVRSLPIRVLDRTMAIDLLTWDGRVVGATGLNVRTGELVVCKAKATILGTGRLSRLYNPRQGGESGKYKMIGFYVGTGDGHAMAFRAGAELLNMEMAVSNSRNLASQYDWLAFHFGGFLTTKVPIVNYRGEQIAERFMHSDRLLEEERAGRGPCFWDPTVLPEGVHQEIERAFQDERPIVARFAKQRGLDTRTHRYEITAYKAAEISPLGGVLMDENGHTSLPGLFAAGDMTGGTNFGGIPGAAVFGTRAGQAAVAAALKVQEVTFDEEEARQHGEIALASLNRRDGVEPLELEMKIRDIMERYCGAERSEGSLKQGLWRLRSVRDRFLAEVRAQTPHELMTANEVRNLFLLGELHLLAALERKQSGLGNYRLDHPKLRDTPWEESIILRKEREEIKLFRQRMPSLKK